MIQIDHALSPPRNQQMYLHNLLFIKYNLAMRMRPYVIEYACLLFIRHTFEVCTEKSINKQTNKLTKIDT